MTGLGDPVDDPVDDPLRTMLHHLAEQVESRPMPDNLPSRVRRRRRVRTGLAAGIPTVTIAGLVMAAVLGTGAGTDTVTPAAGPGAPESAWSSGPTGPAGPASAGGAVCPAASLVGISGSPVAATVMTGVRVNLFLASAAPTCVLTGYPDVVRLDRAQRPVATVTRQGISAIDTTSTRRPVVLKAEQMASFLLSWSPAATCRRTTSTRLRISFPGQRGSLVIDQNLALCVGGQLTVGPVEPIS